MGTLLINHISHLIPTFSTGESITDGAILRQR